MYTQRDYGSISRWTTFIVSEPLPIFHSVENFFRTIFQRSKGIGSLHFAFDVFVHDSEQIYLCIGYFKYSLSFIRYPFQITCKWNLSSFRLGNMFVSLTLRIRFYHKWIHNKLLQIGYYFVESETWKLWNVSDLVELIMQMIYS